MQICSVNYQFYLLVLVVTTFVFIFPFLTAAVRAVSLFRPFPLFFLFAVLYGLLDITCEMSAKGPGYQLRAICSTYKSGP